VAAQQPATLTVAVSQTAPVVDGSVAAGEYTGTLVLGRYSISMSRHGGELYIGMSARTAGWVAVGLGSLKMNGATILIGYVNRDGLRLKVQRGVAHTHTDTPGDALLGSAGTETGGRTTIEMRLKAAPFIAQGATQIQMIVAFGNTDSFTVPHAFRSALVALLSP
jgi:hypothetical protein